MVAPFAGAWIEIYQSVECEMRFESLPSRERGLKFPNAGYERNRSKGRSLRGSVD